MTITCPVCRGASKVTETRKVPIRVRSALIRTGKHIRRWTATRRRQCKECQYVWLTIELAMRSSRKRKK